MKPTICPPNYRRKGKKVGDRYSFGYHEKEIQSTPPTTPFARDSHVSQNYSADPSIRANDPTMTTTGRFPPMLPAAPVSVAEAAGDSVPVGVTSAVVSAPELVTVAVSEAEPETVVVAVARTTVLVIVVVDVEVTVSARAR